MKNLTIDARERNTSKVQREAIASQATAFSAANFPIIAEHWPELFDATNDNARRRKVVKKKPTPCGDIAKKKSAFADSVWSAERKPGFARCGLYDMATNGGEHE